MVMKARAHDGKAPVELGEKLYFFRSSTPEVDQCLIWGHAGLLWGHRQYMIPSGVRLYFFTAPGKRVDSEPGRMIRSGWMQESGTTNRLHVPQRHPSSVVPDYILTKAIGSGFAGTRTVAGRVEKSKYGYDSIRKDMGYNAMAQRSAPPLERPFNEAKPGDWSPHVVSVRRRWKEGKSVQLSEVITAVCAHDDSVRRFYFGGCRGDASGSYLMSAFVKAGIAFIA